MKCPNCKNQLKVADRCYLNAETYGNQVTATTECCGVLVDIRPILSFRVQLSNSKSNTDDWGVPVKKQKLK